MPRRHTLNPLSKSYAIPHSRNRHDDGMWETLDRVQVLGEDGDGHSGCVNALSWSDDGSTLLSGSDDRRICIWQPDPSPSLASSSSPHPLKLKETIATGHRANIFSAKFLPNANTPTIVSCAGDREVWVFQVERLNREYLADRGHGKLAGFSGDGVTVLKCHRDRTKKIATENSPSLFLTVSEDGTVRQHDLRRPHVCRTECPEALFHAPRGVDLYSLSVSTVTPHIFAVAGRTDCAFICDRRMLERQTPSWGQHVRSSGQVHCVRRLGLPDDEWDKVAPRTNRMFGDERHVTCVKMSPEHADEVAVAFAKHSTSLFSIYDSPETSSTKARSSSPTIIPPNKAQEKARRPNEKSPRHRGRESSAPTLPVTEEVDEVGSTTSRDRKRRHSERSTAETGRTSLPHVRQQTNGGGMGEMRPGPNVAIGDVEVGPSRDTRTNIADTGPSRETWTDIASPNIISLADSQDLADDLEAMREAGMDVDLEEEQTMLGLHDGRAGAGPPTPPGRLRARDFLRDDIDRDEDDIEGISEQGAVTEEDEDDLDGMDFDEEEDEEMDDFYGLDDDDGEEMFCPTGLNASRLPSDAFDHVEKILPRRMFRGAKNVETVKDCNFLGTRSDKICSGSDDGNFFVWDKESGKLEGVWEGDGSVVNVMEQHPTLPLVAVSGIDNTVKMFAPTRTLPPAQSHRRTHLAETIIRRNTRVPTFTPLAAYPPGIGGGAFDRAYLMQFLASRGISARFAYADEEGEEGGEGEGEGGPGECTTQ